jgi:hypothetical protein
MSALPPISGLNSDIVRCPFCAINDQSASQQTGPIRSPRPRWRVKSLGWRRRAPSPNVESLHLIERGRERRLWSEALFDFLAGYVRMLAVFQEVRPLVFAEELNDRRGVSRVVLLHRHGHHAETLRLNSGEVPFEQNGHQSAHRCGPIAQRRPGCRSRTR